MQIIEESELGPLIVAALGALTKGQVSESTALVVNRIAAEYEEDMRADPIGWGVYGDSLDSVTGRSDGS